MKNQAIPILALSVILLSLSSCEVIEGIFQAGVGVGVFIVIAIIALVIFLIFRFSGKK
jgi:hypothetical protein